MFWSWDQPVREEIPTGLCLLAVIQKCSYASGGCGAISFLRRFSARARNDLERRYLCGWSHRAAVFLTSPLASAATFEQVTGAGTVMFVNEDHTELGFGHITVSARNLEDAPSTDAIGTVTLYVPSGNQAPTQRGTVQCLDVRGEFASITGVLEDKDQERPYFLIMIRDNGSPGRNLPDAVTVVLSPEPFLNWRANKGGDYLVEQGNFVQGRVTSPDQEQPVPPKEPPSTSLTSGGSCHV